MTKGTSTCRMLAMTTSKAPETGAGPQAAAAKGSGPSVDASHCTAWKRDSMAFRAVFWAAARTARASVSVPYASAAPSFRAAIARTPEPAMQDRKMLVALTGHSIGSTCACA